MQDEKCTNFVKTLKVEDVDSIFTQQMYTVYGFQGHEADIVIVVLTRSSKFGYLNNPELLNVYLSRAKRDIIFIGSLLPIYKQYYSKSITREWMLLMQYLKSKVDGSGNLTAILLVYYSYNADERKCYCDWHKTELYYARIKFS